MSLKRKITYGILGILLLMGLYFWLHVSLGLFTPYNSWTAQQDLKSGKVQIVVIGLAFMPQEHNEVAKKYGFVYTYLGCDATYKLLNGSQNYNHVVMNYLENKYGHDIWEKIEMQVDSINSTHGLDH